MVGQVPRLCGIIFHLSAFMMHSTKNSPHIKCMSLHFCLSVEGCAWQQIFTGWARRTFGWNKWWKTLSLIWVIISQKKWIRGKIFWSTVWKVSQRSMFRSIQLMSQSTMHHVGNITSVVWITSFPLRCINTPDIFNAPDACGLDVYQSYFLCIKGCHVDNTDDSDCDNDNDEYCLTVCLMCYVKGCSCPCLDMEPWSLHLWGKWWVVTSCRANEAPTTMRNTPPLHHK